MACIVDDELVDLVSSTSCNNRGGIKKAFWTKSSNIDWVATAANAAQFDGTNQCVLGYTMIGGATWNQISFKRKGSFYTQSYTSDNQSYEVAITNLFEGKGKELRNALCTAINACNIIYHVFDNNCNERVFGVDWDGDAFNDYIEPFKIIQHDDNSGDTGGDLPSDTVIFGGEAECPALYAEIGQTTFESTYL